MYGDIALNEIRKLEPFSMTQETWKNVFSLKNMFISKHQHYYVKKTSKSAYTTGGDSNWW
jgi:hypothetical protein